MKITEQQIQQLYTFTALHYVEFYDVQTELVDHLANGIEAQWKENPKLKFEDALRIEFKKFGVYGFSDVVEQKRAALSKHYRKLVWKFTKTYFKFPKIIATLFSIWLLFKSLTLIENKNYIVVPVVIFLLVFNFYYLFKAKRETKLMKKKTGKNWLFLHVTSQMGGIIHIFNLGIYIPHFFGANQSWSLTKYLVFSAGAVLYFIVFYVAVNIVSPQLNKTVEKQFPEHKFI
ncbi:hypothetical protein [Neotamlana laminarinivorans]|uniref:Uncharacterized protein n=1 Tax=Neotamlana laminarinivorans TaxID=2883124 RepID=A0A9X1HYY8_9FLAO|nr:hypothetical protein [Tamlana laminarinivorans]MCB4798346.1 hypothetical protein [Tamlana laminarinivorans]